MARKTSSSGSPRSSSSRRKPVTIDLDAKPVDSASPAKADPAAAAKPQTAPAPKAPEKPADAPDTKPADTPGAKPAAASTAAKPAEPAAKQAAEAVPPKSKSSPLSLIAAALIGGIVSLAGAVGLDRLNVVSLFGGPQADAVSPEKIGELESGLEAVRSSAEDMRYQLETQDSQLSALKAQPDAPAGEALGAVQGRIDALQAEIENLSVPTAAAAPDLAPLEARLAELESLIASGGSGREVALEALETRLTGLSEKVEAQGSAADLVAPLNEHLTVVETTQKEAITGLDSKIAKLQSAVEETSTKADEASAKAAEASTMAEGAAPSSSVEAAVAASAAATRKADQAVAIAPVLAAESLQRAIDAGQPFEPALNAFANLGIENPAIAALQPFAAKGLPTIAALRAEYAALDQAFEAAPSAEAEEEAGGLDRLLKGALSVVKVRPAEPQAGDDTAAISSRIKGALADNSLKTALAEWRTLPDDRKAASQAWADKVQAIIQANSFADTVRTNALARLNMTQ